MLNQNQIMIYFQDKPNLHENINNFTTDKVIHNENMRIREIVFKQITDKRVSYSKSHDIPEDSNVNSSKQY